MKIIEHRRHSMRKGPNGVHLIQKGVDLARKTGERMSAFDYVVTSPKERACETAIAMGYAVNELNDRLASYGSELDKDFDYNTLTFQKISQLLSKESLTLKFAKEQTKFLLELTKKIKDGEKLLLISHGGVIEIPLVYLFPNENYTKWEPLFGYCEGYRITIDKEKVINYELLRT